jgi:predicted transcriptional regulator
MLRDSGLHFSGALQQEIMRALWRIGQGTVEDVRSALPKKRRGAYTTVQTVLNRLAERGLLRRQRSGAAIVYEPRMTEAQYLERSLSETLAGASDDARQAALAGLVGDLDDAELKRIRARAGEVARRRRRQ